MDQVSGAPDLTPSGSAPSVTHTPGPWKFRLYATDDDPAQLAKLGIKPIRMLDNAGAMAISTENGRIAMVDCQAPYKRGQGHATECAERDANARLIAAAPDLLAVLQEAIADNMLVEGSDWWGRVHAAIAKASNPERSGT